MTPTSNTSRNKIHRHTGGLEIGVEGIDFFANIHRHTGGLESPNF